MCRREGEKLFLRGDKCNTAHCPIVRRNFKPGVHGPTSRPRPTPYGIQLREKQKVKEIYGIQERQFRNYFLKAKRKIGNTASFMVQMLEMRLDNVVFRLGFGRARSLARQLVSHGHIRVNNKRVTVASYQVKPGDVITYGDRIKKSKLVSADLARIEKHQTPGWLNLDAKELTGKVLNRPEGEDLKQNFDPTKIVEFYSR
jgi:small subunit ribosomal protein S4